MTKIFNHTTEQPSWMLQITTEKQYIQRHKNAIEAFKSANFLTDVGMVSMQSIKVSAKKSSLMINCRITCM